MKFLLIDDEGAPCSLAYQLQQRELHEVQMFIEKPECREHLDGIVAKVQTLEQGLSWLGRSGYFIRGDEEDVSALRGDGYQGYGETGSHSALRTIVNSKWKSLVRLESRYRIFTNWNLLKRG